MYVLQAKLLLALLLQDFVVVCAGGCCCLWSGAQVQQLCLQLCDLLCLMPLM